jgi:hypothetical protein
MKETEEEGRDRIDRLKDDEPKMRFMRKRQAGEWCEYFDDQMNRRFAEVHETALLQLGYVAK